MKTQGLLIGLLMIALIVAVVLTIAGNTAEAPTQEEESATSTTEEQNTNNPVFSSYGEVVVGVGETVDFGALQMRVSSVVEESRCPADVQCIQAGTVRLTLEITSGLGASTERITLGETITTETESITFISVRPYPVSGANIPNSAYEFTFDVQKRANEITALPPSVEEVSAGACYVGGCSSQLCTDSPDMVSTCEYREEYACYQDAVCERQNDGQCGWSPTPALRACLSTNNTTDI